MNNLDKLREIYNKYRKNFSENVDSDQICCMWSTSNPPDVIYCTEQILSIEKEFDVELSEDEAMDIYDMDLTEAIVKIESIKQAQC